MALPRVLTIAGFAVLGKHIICGLTTAAVQS
jgi:hypothetical protein